MRRRPFDTKRMVLLAMLTAILLVLPFTPLGYLTIGPLAITLNMIPVAIGAILLGPGCGAFLGAVFGITSCLQCIGIGSLSPMGAALFEIRPILTLLQRFIPRVLAGWLSGLIFCLFKKRLRFFGYFATGFCAALLNTVLFTLTLVLLFADTPYLQNDIAGRSLFVYILALVGGNAVVEMLATTAIVGPLCKALDRTGSGGK